MMARSSKATRGVLVRSAKRVPYQEGRDLGSTGPMAPTVVSRSCDETRVEVLRERDFARAGRAVSTVDSSTRSTGVGAITHTSIEREAIGLPCFATKASSPSGGDSVYGMNGVPVGNEKRTGGLWTMRAVFSGTSSFARRTALSVQPRFS